MTKIPPSLFIPPFIKIPQFTQNRRVMTLFQYTIGRNHFYLNKSLQLAVLIKNDIRLSYFSIHKKKFTYILNTDSFGLQPPPKHGVIRFSFKQFHQRYYKVSLIMYLVACITQKNTR